MAREGLRTLVTGVKTLSIKEYEEFEVFKFIRRFALDL